ncbi:hypothetical protein [uncultured Cetobacterium sp.]|uniref:hypothetical protein n=1 Tax=uncultured Cetobacterium sp. TaxID=527638 RepID=UPI0026330D26|nr:hypothetical protein [uncultured Cetobacterium sp.]
MYRSSLDIVTINGLVFSNVFKQDFAPARKNDAYLREQDSNGTFEDFENPDKSGEATFSIRSDATNFLKELRKLMETGTNFTMIRDNRNKGGQRETYKKCLVLNDGSASRNGNGTLGNREWKISYESCLTTEGAN